jgi:uncharacterized protein involved in response to NO
VSSAGPSRIALFDAGFRPFFALASACAVLVIALWPQVLAGRIATPGGWPPTYWHGHEMVFGLAAAAIAGFLLTAVPNWTDTTRLSGRPLVLLVCVWLAGRIAVWSASALPAPLVATLDLAFVPMLAGFVGVPIARAGKPHNYPVVGVLIALTLCNAAVHAQMLGLSAVSARPGLLASVYGILILITIIAGRIVPLFTANALRRLGAVEAIETHPTLEAALIPVLIAAAVCAVAFEANPLGGVVQIGAAGMLAWRQLGWRGVTTLGEPILWIVHLGHGWLVVGFALLGLSAFVPAVPPSAGLHALTAGAMGTMILGVMSRVALGHTGRTIVAARTTVVAYGLVIAGAVARVIAPILGGANQPMILEIAAASWALGYLLFCVVYMPVLLRARVDA